MTNPLFDPTANDPVVDDNKDYASELIGEGKRYKDLSAAAKALVDKDLFIERLKAENAEARAALKGEQKMDEFLTKLKSTIPANPGNPSNPGHQPGESDPNQPATNNNNNKTLPEEDILKLLDERDRRKAEEANLVLAVSKVKEAFGANYQHTLAQKAQELGMTPEDLTNLAKTRPQAFLKLVEADKTQSGAPRAPSSSVNTSALKNNTGGERTNAYYKELRKKVGDREFFSPKIQNQLHQDMLRLRESFFN